MEPTEYGSSTANATSTVNVNAKADVVANTTSTSEVRPSKAKGGRVLKRMNTVASTTPLEFQEFSTTMLDNERKKMNAAIAANNADAANAKIRETLARQIKEVPEPAKARLSYEELFIDNGFPDYELLKDHLIREGRLTDDAIIGLVEQATALFREEPNLLELDAPFTVCGDIHGQFYDLMNLLDNAGDPSDTPYLFLGDYVDRGSFSCEVCFLLFCMKINNPKAMYLLRGNHESRAMTNIHNFKVECVKKYSDNIYNKIMDCFDCLPLAAILKCKMIGKFFCVHGGLSPHIQSLDDIRKLNRFVEVPSEGPICDLLWSDPVLEDDEMTDRDISEFREIDYVDNVERGIGYFFGYKAITQFLLKNDLVSVVRAHEVQQDGCSEHMFTRADLAIPLAFTVFSAPNYCDYYANKAAYVKFMNNKYEIYQIESVPHPYWLPDFQNVFSFSIDYVLESVRTMVKGLAEVVVQGNEEEGEDWPEEAKSNYMQKLTSLQSKMKVSNIPAEEPGFENLTPAEKFRIARMKDLKLEKCSPTRSRSLKRRQLKKTHSSFF